MAKKFDTLRADLNDRLDSLPNGEGDKIREKVTSNMEATEVAHQRNLTELRRARQLTQAQMAATLGVTQAQVSRIEHQADLYLSALRNFIEAMGGEMAVVSVFPGEREPVAIPLELLADDSDTAGAASADTAPATMFGMLSGEALADFGELADVGAAKVFLGTSPVRDMGGGKTVRRREPGTVVTPAKKP